MNFASIVKDGTCQAVFVDPQRKRVWPVGEVFTGLSMASSTDLLSFIRETAGNLRGKMPKTGGLVLDEHSLLAPLPAPPRNVMCVGKNYRSHAREFTRSGFDASAAPSEEIPPYPIVFTKPPTSVSGPFSDIPLIEGLDAAVDYEAEVAVVIGTGGRFISRANAMKHVFGFTVVNDVTARDLQKKHKQWFLGKGIDGFCPTGPWIASSAELDQQALRIACRVNGELRQDASTADLIFDVPTLIETISRSVTLVPGDIICHRNTRRRGYWVQSSPFSCRWGLCGVQRRRDWHNPEYCAPGHWKGSITKMRNGLYVEELGGEGAPLIFVHGLGGTSNTWYAQAQVLKRDFRVIGYDLAGSGRSSVPEKDISISSHVEDLRQLARETGGGRVHLAGHSMGTIICQSVAAEWPEIPASLVLAGALHRPAEAARAALTQRAAKARAEGMRGIAEAIVAGGTASDTKVNQPVAAAFVRESLMGQSAEGYARNCEALAQANAADLARISCPVLLLTGDEDKTASPDVARSISTALHKAELQILPACGHWTPVERPKQVSYAMTVFYSRIRRDAAL